MLGLCGVVGLGGPTPREKAVGRLEVQKEVDYRGVYGLRRDDRRRGRRMGEGEGAAELGWGWGLPSVAREPWFAQPVFPDAVSAL